DQHDRGPFADRADGDAAQAMLRGRGGGGGRGTPIERGGGKGTGDQCENSTHNILLGQIAFELRLEGDTKMSSIGRSNSSAIRKASGSEGSYLPVSIAFTLWRETSSRAARSCWLHARSARSTRRRFSISSAPTRRASDG